MSLRTAQFVLALGWLQWAGAVEIAEADYEGRAQFRIISGNATWFYDRAGGGFSRLLDREGRDWIAFHKKPLSQFPASAEAGYRGLPNCVFTGPDKGAGHPGFDQCITERLGTNALRTTSRSGRWQWSWTFHEAQAHFRMEKVDPDHAWWFLYEGPIAGTFAPHEKFWGTDLGGPRFEVPGNSNQLFERWRWVYFGDQSVPRVFFIAQHQPDDLPDTLWFLGSSQGGAPTAPDGMVVFGFGRGPRTSPQFKRSGVAFTVGLVELTGAPTNSHATIASVVERALSHAK
jgi:hypothetical protein